MAWVLENASKMDFDVGHIFAVLSLNPTTATEVLETIAETPAWKAPQSKRHHQTHATLARNRSISTTALTTLAGSLDVGVRYAVAKNKRTPRAVLKALVDDRDDYVRQTAAENLASNR